VQFLGVELHHYSTNGFPQLVERHCESPPLGSQCLVLEHTLSHRVNRSYNASGCISFPLPVVYILDETLVALPEADVVVTEGVVQTHWTHSHRLPLGFESITLPSPKS